MKIPDPSPEFMLRLHATAMVVWVAVTPVTLIFPDSIIWVAFMSQYANFVGHFASLDGARSEKTSKEELSGLREEVAALRELLQDAVQEG